LDSINAFRGSINNANTSIFVLTSRADFSTINKEGTSTRMTAKCRASQNLAGAASLKHRVPVGLRRSLSPTDIAQWVEHQAHNLTVVGSNPAIDSNFGLKSR
jgi:hypothetical protein